MRRGIELLIGIIGYKQTSDKRFVLAMKPSVLELGNQIVDVKFR